MNLVVPWTELTGFKQPFAPANKKARSLYSIATLLSIDFMQQRSGLVHTVTGTAAHTKMGDF